MTGRRTPGRRVPVRRLRRLAALAVAAALTSVASSLVLLASAQQGPEVGDAQQAEDAGGPPPCAYRDVPARIHPEGDGRWTVLDTVFALPESWAPGDLVPAREAGFNDDRSVRAVVVPDLRALREAAHADGVSLELRSAYRSYAYQATTFAYWVRLDGEAAALTTSARPGHSEHQLGTSVDLGSVGGPAPWDVADWARTPEGAWMQRHAWRYGFVSSYPEGASDRSCYAYEPWHWRWIGRELAAVVHVRGALPRDVLWEVSHAP
ncbi:MAG: M15 family metallopeptidase [Trueperaceae bacterium]|nr:M15 family metallopeptidase [Trueperaceae bacterium]